MKKWKVVGPFTAARKPFWSVHDEDGCIITTLISDEGNARLIAQLPELKELRYKWATIINRLACIALDGAESNDRDYAQDMIEMAMPYLDGEFCGFEEETV